MSTAPSETEIAAACAVVDSKPSGQNNIDKPTVKLGTGATGGPGEYLHSLLQLYTIIYCKNKYLYTAKSDPV